MFLGSVNGWFLSKNIRLSKLSSLLLIRLLCVVYRSGPWISLVFLVTLSHMRQLGQTFLVLFGILDCFPNKNTHPRIPGIPVFWIDSSTYPLLYKYVTNLFERTPIKILPSKFNLDVGLNCFIASALTSFDIYMLPALHQSSTRIASRHNCRVKTGGILYNLYEISLPPEELLFQFFLSQNHSLLSL